MQELEKYMKFMWNIENVMQYKGLLGNLKIRYEIGVNLWVLLTMLHIGGVCMNCANYERAVWPRNSAVWPRNSAVWPRNSAVWVRI